MTFIYRQVKSAESYYNPYILCSDTLENLENFPFEGIYYKHRNFIRKKKSFLYRKIFGSNSLLSTRPKLSLQQKKYFEEILSVKKTKMIHAHFGPSGLEILSTAQKLDIPLLVTFHGYDASILLNMKEYRENIQSVFKYAQIVSVSFHMREQLISAGAIKKNIHVIRCGIPIDFFDFVRRKPVSQKIREGELLTFLQVSNFVEKKGHLYTVLAFNNFLKNYKNSKLILAGDGSLRNSIMRLCTELKIDNYVEFPGLVNSCDVRRLMKEADVFLHHSVTSVLGDKEGVPTVIMEAMATGLPVISTFHAGIPELIDNDQNGFLVKERDVDSYSEVLSNLANLLEDIGERARDKVMREFNLEKETLKLFSLYNVLLSSD